MDLKRETCIYTSQFCEENVYKLIEKISVFPNSQTYVVLISNERKKVPLFCQRGSTNAEELVIWDYHVIVIASHGQKWIVYDFDANLNFPCDFSEYWSKIIRKDDLFNDHFRRLFRVVKGNVFLDHFSSDRHHMVNSYLEGASRSEQWIAPPPSYPPIRGRLAKSAHNLSKFIKMSHSLTTDTMDGATLAQLDQMVPLGRVFTNDQFKTLFS